MTMIALVIADITAMFGFGEIASGAAEIPKVLFSILLVIGNLLFLLGLATYKAVA